MTLEPFDWNDWRQRFHLKEDALADVPGLFPRILVAQSKSKTGEGEQEPDLMSVPLDDMAVNDLVGDRAQPAPKALFESYLRGGELGAARLLLGRVIELAPEEETTLNRQFEDCLNDWDLTYRTGRSALTRIFTDLVNLSEMARDDADTSQALARADLFINMNRYGPACDLIGHKALQLKELISRIGEDLKGKVDELAARARKEVKGAVRAEVEQTLAQARQALAKEQVYQANRAYLQARMMVDSGDLPGPGEGIAPAQSDRERGPFPNIRSSTIQQIKDGRLRVGAFDKDTQEFYNKWYPEEWRKPELAEQSSARILNDTIKNLSRLSGESSVTFPYSMQVNDPWFFFVKNLFTLLGFFQMEPHSMKDLVVRTARDAPRGYYLGYCNPRLKIKFSFIDSSRFTDGLPVILWHKPNDPYCPRPANLQAQIEGRSLDNKPLIVLACEPISPEARVEFRRINRSAAILDERDLLEIIFAGSTEQERQQALARAITRQLPADRISPYTLIGDVPSAMFTGRKDVLDRLSNPLGPSIVYGGRMLGKSSIFKELQRLFERKNEADRANGSVYCADYSNAIAIIDDETLERNLLPQIQSRLYMKLREGFSAVRERPLDFKPNQPDPGRLSAREFFGWINFVLRELKEARILLLIDEADSLLQFLDVPNNPAFSEARRFGWLLRALIQEFDGRFDVRFAGFQDIYRAAQSPSGPFYNFRQGGEFILPLSVFTEEEAYELITQPLALLNVTFKEPDLVDFIIDITGSHPALIQEFCKRLFDLVCDNRKNESGKIEVSRAHVEGIWFDSGFRKNVIKAIHLNVDTRHTKTEKILRLLLYLWVRQMMAPGSAATLPVVCTANDLFDLLAREFEPYDLDRHIAFSALDSYLQDLVTLGVLKKIGKGYIFRYRHFAGLLYHDYFGGHMSQEMITALRDNILRHEDLPPRAHIRMGKDLSVSPFTRADQSMLEDQGQRVALILGAPGTGKTQFLRWLARINSETPEHNKPTQHVDYPQGDLTTLDGLFVALRNSFNLSGEISNWETLDQRLRQALPLNGLPYLFVLDGMDKMARDPQMPLALWPDQREVNGCDGLLELITTWSKVSEGGIRFALTGSFPLARLWLELRDQFEGDMAVAVTRRLELQERASWFQTWGIPASDEVRSMLWKLTGGDWRLLGSFKRWYKTYSDQNKLGDVLEEQAVVDFRKALTSPDLADLPDLREIIENYDPLTRSTLRIMTEASQLYGADQTLEDWAEVIVSEVAKKKRFDSLKRLNRFEWMVQVRACLLLQELKEAPGSASAKGSSPQIRLPFDDTWFNLVVNTNV